MFVLTRHGFYERGFDEGLCALFTLLYLRNPTDSRTDLAHDTAIGWGLAR